MWFWAKRLRAGITNSDNKDEIDEDDDCSLAQVKESVEYIATHFRFLLGAKGVLLCPKTNLQSDNK